MVIESRVVHDNLSARNEESAFDAPAIYQTWSRAFKKFGCVPNQSPEYFQSMDRSSSAATRVVVKNDSAISVFRLNKNVAICEMAGAGLLPLHSEKVRFDQFVEKARRSLNVETLYFPLLYEDVIQSTCAKIPADGLRYARRPSPTIDWNNRGADVWERCSTRLGTRAERRLKRFHKSGAYVTTLSGRNAIVAIEKVERNSWKAKCKVDLFNRAQIEFVRNLVEKGILLVRVAHIHTKPVAFRLDFRVSDTVFCYKWSFDEDARRLSPGFFLITKDLEATYGKQPLKMIDLFGSPDSLKNAVSNGERERFDLIWPNGDEASQIAEERMSHDRNAEKAHSENKGIRSSIAGNSR